MKLKISLLFSALLCVLAIFSTSAFAVNVYEGKVEPGKTQGKNYILTINELELKCEKVELSWLHPLGLHSTLKIVPAYNGCKFERTGGSLKVASIVNVGKCEYEYGTSVGLEGGSQFKINTTIIPSSCEIIDKGETKTGNCTLKLKGENNKEQGQVKFINTTEGGQVKTETAGIAWNSTEIGCEQFGIKGVENKGTNGKETGLTEEKGIRIVRSGTEITTNPPQVEFGSTTSAEDTVEYTNKGSLAWHVPALEYTVKEGLSEAVTNKNGCNGRVLGSGEKCSVVLTYKVPKQENYKAELKLGSEAPTVSVKAEAPKIVVSAANAQLKFGTAKKVTGIVTYTNEGPGSWSAPKIEYTVLKGAAKTVKIAGDSCKGTILNKGEKCSVTLTREAPEREYYKAEMKFGSEAPTVLVEAVGPLINVSPTEVNFGSGVEGEEVFEYTNTGTEGWLVPALKYVVNKGLTAEVEITNGCENRTIPVNEKCSIDLIYRVKEPESYRAELKLGSIAPIVIVEAEA